MKRPLAFVLIFVLGTSACESDVLDKHSNQFNSNRKKVAFLDKYVVFYSDVIDAEFDLFNVNGGSSRFSVPGASSGDYKFAVRVAPQDVQTWIDAALDGDYVPKDGVVDDSWVVEVTGNADHWQPQSAPEKFERTSAGANRSIMIVHREEGIIFKQVKWD